jgi:cysteine synthase
MASRGVAILPEGMSRERFDWLNRWCENPEEDVIRTYGTESNVKEIYDACNALAKDPGNFILNQFSEFGNHLGHYAVTGRALGHVFETVRDASGRDLRLAAFTSATGSAGTIGAGDRLKDEFGAKIVAVEALECPTMLENGYGEHNIQGIGDKHIPLIHNVMNADVVCAISDVATDELDVLWNTDQGREYLSRKGVTDDVIASMVHFGFSSTCNVLAAIKTAKLLDLGSDDAIVTVATDGGAMYPSERAKTLASRYRGEYSHTDAAEAFGAHLGSVSTEHMIEMTEADRRRVFQLGYYTWVEQQGTPFELFEERRSQTFWRGLRRFVRVWDEMIADFNARVGSG